MISAWASSSRIKYGFLFVLYSMILSIIIILLELEDLLFGDDLAL